jgi:radical SAM superfamily enzyme YgiQ (UPF0313 family)
MMRLAELIEQRGIRKNYYCYARSDTVLKHPELFRRWRDVGLERVFVGFEFFKDQHLEDVNKRATVEENEGAMRLLAELGISLIASFLVKPDFDRADFRACAAYCKRMKKELRSSVFLFSVLTPLPGSDLFDASEGQLITRDYDHFDLFHPVLPTKLPMEEFFAELHGLYQALNGPQEMLPTLSRYRVRDLPDIIGRFVRVSRQMRAGHTAYGAAPTQEDPA